MRTHYRYFGRAALVLGVFVALASPVQAQQTPGNLVIYRIGNGSAPLTNASTAVFVDQYTSGGTLVNTVAITSSGPNALTAAGTETSEGYLTRSTNGLQIVLPGYNANTGIAIIKDSVLPRIVGSVNASGTYSLVASFGGIGFSGENIRGAAADGTNYWGSGNANITADAGIWFTSDTAINQVSNNPISNVRNVNIFGGQLFLSAQTGTRGIYAVGTGLPTNGGTVATLVIGTGATSQPVAFSFNTARTVAYVADDRTDGSGGIQKWILSGGTWSLAYTLGTGVASSGARGLTVDWSNPISPTIFGTSTEGVTAPVNRLFRVRDTGSGSNAGTIATSGTNSIFRGVDFAVLPAVWIGTSSGTQNWSEGGSTPWTNWSVGLADGINVSFQDTNAGPTPLNITANNNTSLTSASSIMFQATGFGGGGGGTAYTLTGSGLTLGSSTYAAGVKNDSGLTQTINLNLTLGASQSFDANAGNLVFGGNINLGSGSNNYTLTVTGSSDTTISGNIANGGAGNNPLIKSGSGTLTLTGNNSYSGGTTISGGTLVANSASGTSPTGSGAVTVANGGTLRGGSTGGGTIAGAVTVQSGGTLAPGDVSMTGQLKVGNNVTFQSGAAFTTRIQGLGAGVNYDQLFLTAGNVALDGTYTASLSGFTPTPTDRMYVINNTGSGTLTGTFSNASNGSVVANFGGVDWAIYYNADVDSGALTGGNDVAVAPVPEPAHLLLVCAAGLGLGGLVRRRLRRVNLSNVA